jgi:hypothetical protein
MDGICIGQGDLITQIIKHEERVDPSQIVNLTNSFTIIMESKYGKTTAISKKN